ncbi:MAG: 50S ribosomal protein L15 [Mycoplasmataceae bacterium]|jgi:large subunit ribosomal protein L15|nr:50S ribosomal protein L15 [Mycoplasmataceae bacterium]
MNLHSLKYVKGSRNHKCKVAGRGFGSGSKRGFRGQDGQKKTQQVRIGFEGGQTPLYRKLPKFGFSNYNHRTNYLVLSLKDVVNYNFTNINLKTLCEHKIIRNEKQLVKIIGNDKISKKLTISGIKVTAGARKAIVDVGGEVIEKESN